MEPIGRPRMGSNTNATVATAASAISAVVGLPLSPARLSVSTVASNTKTAGLCHNRVPLQHCSTGSNVIHHLQYPAIQPPSIRPPLIHSTHNNSLLSTSPQLMLSTTTATTSEVLPQYQQHNVGSHQLVTAATVPVSTNPIVMPTSNITSVGMALSPFGILPHERVMPQQTYHRHQHRKLPTNVQASKTLIDTNNSSGPQILPTPTINSQRFYAEPTHLSNKMKQYESVQHQQQQNNRNKIPNGILDKSLPVVSSGYVPQSYEQRYQPRTASQQVGYMSVITRTAGTTSNGIVMDDIAANNNYYQAQAIPLQSKTSDIHGRPYYHFDNTVSASQTPQQQLDNMLLMGSPVQRGDPMHIVKNLQSMQTEIDCYGIKKIIEHQPRSLATDNSKTVGPTTLLGNSSKCIIEQQHQHLQLPKSAVIDSSLSYNGQYFNKLQPPPAHLQHHTVTGNSKMLPTPTSLTVVSTNGNTYMDVQQHQINHRWNSDQQKPPIVSTSSCFSGNISTGVYHQPTTPIQHQNYNNAVSTFNVQPSGSNLHQHQQMLQPAHHNNFTISNVSSINPTYYNPTTMVSPSSTASSVNTISPPPPPPSILLYNRHQQSTTNNFNNVQSGNFVANDNNSSLPNVIVPDIEEELSYLCDDSTSTSNTTVKPLNITTQQPSFIDSYIKFIRGDTGRTATKMDNECNDRPKKLLQPLMATPKHISKPYIPMPKSKVISTSEQTSSRNGACKNVKKKSSNVMKTTDDDPRYFPLPKTSSITDNSDGENSWLSADDDNFNWSTSSKTVNNTAKPVIKNKADLLNRKKTNNVTAKRKTNSTTAIKKQKTQHEQPRRQLSHRMAKEKTQKLLSSINGELDLDDDILSEVDSDVDPAWIPNNEDTDTSKNVNLLPGRYLGHKKFSNSGHMPSTSSSINNNNLPDDSLMPFKSGTFVVLKSEFEDNGKITPKHLWRVDGKSMLQKFEQLDGDNVYKSVSTYTGWSPSYYELYCQVSVELVTSYKSKCVSTKLPAEILVQIKYDDNNKTDQNNSVVNTKVGLKNVNHINETKVSAISSIDDQIILLRSNFDVYIQTLASQALDSNFLGEIYRENDDYFLSNMRAIETVTQSWVHAIDSTIMEDSKADLSIVHTVISRYPMVKLCSSDEMSAQLHCIMCSCQGFIGKQQKFVKVSLSGSEYNAQTLKTIDSNRVFSKKMKNEETDCLIGETSIECNPKKITCAVLDDTLCTDHLKQYFDPDGWAAIQQVVHIKKLNPNWNCPVCSKDSSNLYVVTGVSSGCTLNIMPVKTVYCCTSAQCIDKLSILHSLKHLKYNIYETCCKRITAENDNCRNELTQDKTTVLNRLLADDKWIDKLYKVVCDTWSRAESFVSNRQSNSRVSSS